MRLGLAYNGGGVWKEVLALQLDDDGHGSGHGEGGSSSEMRYGPVDTTILGRSTGDTFGRGLVCTLGDGVGGVQVGTVGRRACAIREGDNAEGGTGSGCGTGLVVRRKKILLRSLMARNWALLGCWYSVFGCRLVMALARAMAAWVALSTGEEEGTTQLWGKNSTVMLSCSPREAGM